MKFHWHPLPTTFEEKVADFIFARFTTSQCGLDGYKAVCSCDTNHLNVVAKEFVLELQSPEILGGQGRSNRELSCAIKVCGPAIGVLVLFDMPPTEAHGVFGSFGVEVFCGSNREKKTRCCDYLPLSIAGFEAGFPDALSSCGV